jgi:hypothetical protein
MTRHRQGNDKARMGHGGCNQADRDRMRLNETGREGAERGVGTEQNRALTGWLAPAPASGRHAAVRVGGRLTRGPAVWAAPHSKAHTCPAP